jgi:HAD superfamily hydrolase (TIGR01459 family)
MARLIESLADIAADYDALYCDIWGCLHDGIRSFPAATGALQSFREAGGRVILLTNAPRPSAEIAVQITGLGVPRDAWDSIATSGDSARMALFQGAVGHRVYHIGVSSDLGFFEPPQVLEDPAPVERVPLAEAEGIVCTGPFDALADLDTLRPDLLRAKIAGLPLLCANPDIVVDRGTRREWCAGAVARLYTEMGGRSLYFGKPHPPIYDLARRQLSDLGADIPTSRILAIGDGIATDVAGAQGEDIDVLFVTGGLAAKETLTARQPDPDALARFLQAEDWTPTFAIGHLR